jgi:hypothetical protein
MSTSTGGTTCSALTGDGLLEAIATSNLQAVAAAVAAIRAGGAWPISPAACLFAAVKLRQRAIAEHLLESGAPPQFLVSELPGSDAVALGAAGISADGVGHWSPLVIAVRQNNPEVAQLLLQRGASAQVTIAGMPLLLHFYEAAPPVPLPSGSSGGGGGAGDGAGGGSASGGAGPSSSSSQGGASSSQGGGGGGSASDVLALIQQLDERLRLLALMMRHGADPCQPSLATPQHNFLTGEGRSCPMPCLACPVLVRW